MAFGGWYGWGFGRHRSHRGWSGRLDEETTRLALLALVEEKPRLGYELLLDLEERAAEVFDVHADDVYPVLQLLVDAELVEVTFDEDRKLYRLTEAGRREVEDRRREVEGLWRRMEGPRTAYACSGDWDSLEADLDEVADHVRSALHDVGRSLSEAFGGGFFHRRRSRRGRRRRRHHRRCC